MKYLLIALLLCVLEVGFAQDGDYYEEAADADAGAYYDGYYGEGDYYTSGPSTEPKPMRRMFDVSRWDINDVVDKVEDEDGTRYVFVDDVVEAVKDDVIPELCYLTSENITIYNSFLLDSTCLAEFESVSPQCVQFKCNLAHYFLEHGARIFMDFLDAPSIKDGMEVVHRELTNAFEKLDMCTCGREFFKAAFKCAPFYYSNALYAASGNDEDFMFGYGKLLRNVDVKSASRFFDRLMAGVCYKDDGDSKMCLSHIFNGFETLADVIGNTMEGYEEYDDADRKQQKSLEKQCDNVFASIRAWEKDDREMYDFDGEEAFEFVFNKTSAATKAFYCNKKCKKDETRAAMYPCCLRKMLEDEKMWDNVVRVIESVYHVLPAMSSDFDWEFYELESSFYRWEYSKEELADILAWRLPKRIRDSFMQTVHAAKYCEGKIIRCSK